MYGAVAHHDDGTAAGREERAVWSLERASFPSSFRSFAKLAAVVSAATLAASLVVLATGGNHPTLESEPPTPLEISAGPSCAASAGCSPLGLAGDCCPTTDGVTLGCCGVPAAPFQPTSPPTPHHSPIVTTPVSYGGWGEVESEDRTATAAAARRVNLLRPIDTKAPMGIFKRHAHPLSPVRLSDPLIASNAPLHTNKFTGNLFVGDTSQSVWSFPPLLRFFHPSFLPSYLIFFMFLSLSPPPLPPLFFPFFL